MAITISNVRLSYCNLFTPQAPKDNPAGEKKFSCTVLVPKTNIEAKAAIDAAIAQAIEAGPSKCWNGVRPPQPAICVHDGDGVRPSDGMPFGSECKGMWVFTASSKADRHPFVVDRQVQPIMDSKEIYSGVWANISVGFYPYNFSGKKGIGCGLNGVQKLRDDEPLDGRVTAQDAFNAVAVAPAAPAYGEPMAAAGAAWGVPEYTNPWG